jgi:hypothetical protein
MSEERQNERRVRRRAYVRERQAKKRAEAAAALLQREYEAYQVKTPRDKQFSKEQWLASRQLYLDKLESEIQRIRAGKQTKQRMTTMGLSPEEKLKLESLLARERTRVRVKNESPEQRERRLEQLKAYAREKYEEDKERARARQRKQRQNETPEQREKRLRRVRAYQKEKREELTTTQREKRLNETPEKREKRLAQVRAWKANRKEEMRTQKQELREQVLEKQRICMRRLREKRKQERGNDKDNTRG